MSNENEGISNPAFEDDGKKVEPTKEDSKSTEPKKELTKTEKAMKFKILKNVLIISFAFMLNFTSFNSMANLQSSINEKLGTTSLWVLYASLVLSCAFVPSLLISKLKVKWTIPLCILGYSAYIAAQFYPTWGTLIPGAILVGLGAAPMWSAKCSYLTQVGELYGELVGERGEVIITRFFGIFFLFFQSSQIWGNLISSTILSSGVETIARSDDLLELCGGDFCPTYAANFTTPSTDDPEEVALKNDNDKSKIITLSVIFLCCSVASAVIIALLVDPLSKLNIKEKSEVSSQSGTSLLVATFTHMQKINQILVIPMTLWSGLEQSFFSSIFTWAFVTCGLGVHMVGYVLICYGVCDALCSIGFSPLVKRFGRVPFFTFGAILNFTLLGILNSWKPHPSDLAIFFIVASLWGIADAIWQTQINAFYGVLFPGEAEAAFSNYRLWESIGFIVGYVFSGDICTRTNIFIMIGFLSVSMLCYYVVEFFERRGGLTVNGRKIKAITDLFSGK